MPHYSSNILAPPYNYDVPSGDAPGQIPVWDGQFWKVGEGGSPFFIKPLGGGADDWPRLNSILAAAAGVAPVVMGPGIWNCATPGIVPSNTVLIGSPGTDIRSTLTFSGGFVLHCVFDTGRATLNPITTLAANNTPGTRTVSTNATVLPGTIIAIVSQFGSKLLVFYYTVITVGGGGPFTLTLDRPVLSQFATADIVYSIASRAQNIRIYGNGMRITGTGDTALQFWACIDCHAFDVNIDDSFGQMHDYSAALDLGCQNSSFTRIKVHATGLGIVMSSTEYCTFRDCSSSDILGLSNAFQVFDGQECSIINCEGYGSAAGVLVGSNGTSGGCRSTYISGKFFSNTNGIYVNNGSQNTVLDVDCRFNGRGIKADNTGAVASNIRTRGNVSDNVTLDVDVDPTVVAGFAIEPRTLLFFGAGLVDAGGNTLSLWPGSSPAGTLGFGAIAPMRVSQGVLRNLRVSHAVAGTAGTNITYTVYKNGAPTALTCAVDAAAASGADTNPAHAVTVAEGDKIAMLETNPAIAASPQGLEATIEHSAF